jgi:hypothetical protein
MSKKFDKMDIDLDTPMNDNWCLEISNYIENSDTFEPLNVMVTNNKKKDFFIFVFEGNVCEMAVMNKAFNGLRNNPDMFYTQEDLDDMVKRIFKK